MYIYIYNCSQYIYIYIYIYINTIVATNIISSTAGLFSNIKRKWSVKATTALHFTEIRYPI